MISLISRHFGLFFLLISLAGLSSGCAAASAGSASAPRAELESYEDPEHPGWLLVSSDLGGFRALMPSTPRRARESGSGTQLWSHRIGAVYLVSFHDDDFFRKHGGRVRGALETFRGRRTYGAAAVLASTDESLDGNPGAQALYRTKDGKTVAYRAYVSGTRVYELIVSSSAGESFPEEDARLFFSSVHLRSP